MEKPDFNKIAETAKEIVDPFKKVEKGIDLVAKGGEELENLSDRFANNKNNRWYILLLLIAVGILTFILIQSVKNGKKIEEVKQTAIDKERTENKDLYKGLYFETKVDRDSLAKENSVLKAMVTEQKVTISRLTQVVEYLNTKK